ncbi:class I SAM-dependent methyltransferase [Pseudactinotalea sp.]|uniref:class I SAM-dependent methyltransferase n=1 Tax=Pseudactinotalea sp. TaxID=1926260 RepID=UPI003B3B3DF5
MVEKSLWTQQVEQNPEHSHWYIQRFKAMADAGQDLHGEARMVDAMVGRGARVLDAGCGPGRLGGELARRGHTVVGVDVDPVLIEAAQAEHPDATWITQDLAELDLAGERFDVVVSAGNVMTFLAPSTRGLVLCNLATVLAEGGRLVAGFGAGRGYPFEEFFDDARDAGLTLDVALSTWDLRPWQPDSEFLVAVLRQS